jgi:hypothetical protein
LIVTMNIAALSTKEQDTIISLLPKISSRNEACCYSPRTNHSHLCCRRVYWKLYMHTGSTPKHVNGCQGSNHISSLMRKVAYRFGITRYKATVYRSRGVRSKDHILHYQSIQNTSLIEPITNGIAIQEWQCFRMTLISMKERNIRHTNWSLIKRCKHLQTNFYLLEGEPNTTYLIEYPISLFDRLKYKHKRPWGKI